VSVEFTTKDAAAAKQVLKLYESAKQFDGKGWAILGQVYLEPETAFTDSVRVRMTLVEPYWFKQFQDVIDRMNRATKRRREP
jgi:hypothetical protein